MNYEDFLEKKRFAELKSGFEIELSELPSQLYDFQKAIVRWALKRGKGAIFADTGLGKTFMQAAWADKVKDFTNGQVLILTPHTPNQLTSILSPNQTEKSELGALGDGRGVRGIEAGSNPPSLPENNARNASNDDKKRQNNASHDASEGDNASMGEGGERMMLAEQTMDKFAEAIQQGKIAGIVLDESSILKHEDGKTRNKIIELAQNIPYRLSCTATPSPNDYMEQARLIHSLRGNPQW